MLKGFAYTAPTVGRIAIGEVVERDGKRLPAKLDHFVVTSNVKRADGWVEHPVMATLKKGGDESEANKKLREIPIRLMFSNPELNFRESYEAFEDGRQLCVSKGASAKRRVDGRIESLDCPGPDVCEFGAVHRCKPFGRLNVQIDGQTDMLSTFIFRTRGFNSVRTLRSKLEYLHSLFGNRLAGLPLKLVIRGKTEFLYYSGFYLVDIEIRYAGVDGMRQAIQEQKVHRPEELNLNYDKFEERALQLLQNGAFEETEDDVEQFEELVLGDLEEGKGRAPAPVSSSGQGSSYRGLDALRKLGDEHDGVSGARSGANVRELAAA